MNENEIILKNIKELTINRDGIKIVQYNGGIISLDSEQVKKIVDIDNFVLPEWDYNLNGVLLDK